MIAIDTNILVYAHRRDSQWYASANAAIAELAQGRARWALPWPCLHEFFGVVTHPRIYDPPSSTQQAIDQIDAWLESPSVELITEEVGYWPALRELLKMCRIQGPRVHDARVATLCELHGVTTLWSADRDFSRFPSVVTHNPLPARPR